MKILLIGGGGREHALAWKIKQSPHVAEIFCAPGNAGTAEVAKNVAIPADGIDPLLQFALDNKIDMTVVGPENPLVMGIADRFAEKNLKVFGPSAAAARIEGSKVFAKNLMQKYNIPTGEYETFDSAEKARAYVKGKGALVVKADGLAAGKGVFVCKDEAAALHAIEQIMEQKVFGTAGDQILIEEKLAGPEVSFLAFTDGENLLPMAAVQDHKPAYDNDEGPNTGGMGTYSPAPIFTPELEKEVMATIMAPTIQAMQREGCAYRGVLYAGLMITADGPKVLEFNARFGDPETQVLMARMNCDIVPVMQACTSGTRLATQTLAWHPEPAVCVVMAAAGYPGPYEKGKPITGLKEAAENENVQVFHAGTKTSGEDVVTNGGRVLGVTALGADFATAIDNAYTAVGKINWEGIHYRKDIGNRARPGAG